MRILSIMSAGARDRRYPRAILVLSGAASRAAATFAKLKLLQVRAFIAATNLRR
jgi:hypothetical protein